MINGAPWFWYAQGTPDQAVSVGANVNFHWDAGAPTPPFSGDLPTDHFSTAFAGKITAPVSGSYTFFPSSDEVVPVELFRAETAAPPAPTDLSADVQGNVVTFSFTDNATNEWAYALERAPAGTGDFRQVKVGGIRYFSDYFWQNVPFRDVLPKGGDYDYRVRASNAEGSAVSDTVRVTVDPVAPQPGAQGIYYDMPFWGAGTAPAGNRPIAYGGAAFTETMPYVDFDWSAEPGNSWGIIPQDHFSTVFTGTIRTVEAGTYTFLAESDDDGYLYVNGELVSADPGGHGKRDPRGAAAGGLGATVVPIMLEANTEYNFVALQSEWDGMAGITLRWIRPGMTNPETIPAEQYASNYPSAAGGTAFGAPAAPADLSVVGAAGSDFVSLSWNDSATNEMRYVLERAGGPGFADVVSFELPINSTSYIDAGLTPSSEYRYRLRAVNFFGESTAAETAVTTADHNAAPAAPDGLRAVPRSSGVRLAFVDRSVTEDRFVVERAPASDPSDFHAVGSVPGTARGTSGASLLFTDPGVVSGESYVYRVVAEYDGGASPPSDTYTVRAGSPGGTGVLAEYFNGRLFTGQSVLVSPEPAERDFMNDAPADLPIDPDDYGPPWGDPYSNRTDTFSGVFYGELLAEFSEPYTFYTNSDDGIDLTLIDPDTGRVLVHGPNEGIHFERGMNPGFAEAVGTVGLEAGKRYRIQWRFNENFGAAGYRVGWSSPSTPQEVLPSELLFPLDPASSPLSAPADLAGSSLANERITLTWTDANLGESAYFVERSPAGRDEWVVLGQTPANADSFVDSDPGLELDATYDYRVMAVRDGQGGPVATVSVSTEAGGDGMVYLGSALVLGGPDPRYGFTPADGLAFVIRRDSNSTLGSDGSGLGYQGIPQSVAIKFDLYSLNSQSFPAPSTTGIYADGAMDDFNNQVEMPFSLGDGQRYRVQLQYDADAGTLLERVFVVDAGGFPDYGQWFEQTWTDFYSALYSYQSLSNVPFVLGGNYAYFGFTGATGGYTAEQQVSNFFLNGQRMSFSTGEPETPPDNAAPVADAGGPYAIAEGDSVDLAATASDADGDELEYAWDVNDDGFFTDATGSSATFTWAQLQSLGLVDGPAVHDVRVRVSDGHGNVVIATATLNIANAAPTGTFSNNGPTDEGGAATASFSSVSDPGFVDTQAGLRFSFALSQDGLIGDYASASTNDNAPFTFDDNGTYVVWGRVIDQDGGYTDYSTTVTVNNVAPTAHFTGGGTATEGGGATFSFDGAVDPSGADIGAGLRYSFARSAAELATSYAAASTGTSQSFGFADEGSYTIWGRVFDKDGGYTDYSSTVTVDNAAPAVGPISGAAAPVRLGVDVSLGASFQDAGVLDTHTAAWDWGDGTTSAGAVTESGGSGSAQATHRYAAAGLYTVTLTIADGDGGSGQSVYRYVVVYDPSASASGTGWFGPGTSSAALTFSAKYQRNSTVPTGDMSFATQGILFRSTGLDWLVVRGNKAYLRGTGTVNGQAGYSFQVTAIDKGKTPGIDQVRIKIWNTASGAVIYDSQPGALDDADPTTVLGGGGVDLKT